MPASMAAPNELLARDPTPSAFPHPTPARPSPLPTAERQAPATSAASLCSCRLVVGVVNRVARQQMRRPPRVFGGDQRRPRAARAAPERVMSSRLPIGVATTNSVPGMIERGLLYHWRIVTAAARPRAPDHCCRSHARFRTTSALRRRPARVPARDASDARHARRRARPRRSARGPRAATASTRETRALSGYLRRLDEIDRDGLTDGRAPRAPDARRQPPRPHVRARRGPHLGAQSAVLRRHPRVEPRRPGALHPRAGGRTRPPRAVEAAADAAAHPGGARQHQGAARASSSRSASRRCAARSSSSTTICRARSRTSTTCTCSAISPTRRPKRRRPSAPTSSISRPTSRRRRAPRSGSGASSSSRS